MSATSSLRLAFGAVQRGLAQSIMFITEQAFLLTTRAEGVPHLRVSLREQVLRSALLCDLAAHNLIMIEDRGLLGKRVRPVVPSTHVGDPLLRHGVERLEQRRPRTFQRLLKDRRFATEEAVTQRLVRQGVLAPEPRRVLLFSWISYPACDPTVGQQLRSRLQQAVLNGVYESWDEAVTLALLTQAPGGITALREGQKAMGFFDTRKTLKEIHYSVTDPALDRTSALVADTLTASLRALAAIARRKRLRLPW